MKEEMVLYKKRWDYGSCSCMAGLLLFTFLVMIIISYFSKEEGALRISIYAAVALVLLLLAVQLTAYINKRMAKTAWLTVSRAGLHYYGHTATIPWEAISDIQIIDRKFSVSAGQSRALDFTLNLLDTDLDQGFDDFCVLLNHYYSPRAIYIYESALSCGC